MIVRALPFTLVLSVLGGQGPVGIFTAQSDVGRATGSASYDSRQQTYLVAGSGQNMWESRDDFHFVWKRISGNFILSTRASSARESRSIARSAGPFAPRSTRAARM